MNVRSGVLFDDEALARALFAGAREPRSLTGRGSVPASAEMDVRGDGGGGNREAIGGALKPARRDRRFERGARAQDRAQSTDRLGRGISGRGQARPR